MANPTGEAARLHYSSDDVDHRFLAAARDFLLPHLRPGRILNVGLGYGVWDEWLAASGNDVVGLDSDAELVSHFTRRFPTIRYICADAQQYRPDERFTTIVASHILEHLDAPVETLELWRDLLSADGRILIVVPNADSLHRHIGTKMGLLDEITSLSYGDELLGHRRVYTRALLLDHLSRAGLEAEVLTSITLKPLANAQLEQLPGEYLRACL